MNKLWTHDFTIITIGTVITMLGNAVSGFAISLLVLDYTGSTFLFALFMVVYNLPKIIMPLISGSGCGYYIRKMGNYAFVYV